MLRALFPFREKQPRDQVFAEDEEEIGDCKRAEQTVLPNARGIFTRLSRRPVVDGFADQAVEIGPRDVEALGGERLIAVTLLHGFHGHADFIVPQLVFEEEVPGSVVTHRITHNFRAAWLKLFGQMGSADCGGAAHGVDQYNGALNDVLGFANVAPRPGIFAQKSQSRGLQCQ